MNIGDRQRAAKLSQSPLWDLLDMLETSVSLKAQKMDHDMPVDLVKWAIVMKSQNQQDEIALLNEAIEEHQCKK